MKFKFSEKGKQQRFAQWEKIGVERIKADLIDGGWRLVGGPPEERELAWEWVQMKEAEAKQPKPNEIVQLKPSAYGVSIDLKEAWRRMIRRFRK